MINSPDSPALDELCQKLSALAADLDQTEAWPSEQLRLCADYGVPRWFLPPEWGGLGWSDADVARGYLRLSAACLTTTFIFTQRAAASSRIVDSANDAVKAAWLPGLASGEMSATVGISHLTTSRRHLAKPVLRATDAADGYRLDGFSPWVTGGAHADLIVTGATLDDGRQILVAMPRTSTGVSTPEPPRLVGVSASKTGEVRCNGVLIPRKSVLAGPIENVMQAGAGAGTGGLQTSTLAVGLASASVAYLTAEAEKRADLLPAAEGLADEQRQLERELLALASGEFVCSKEDLRSRANSLVLRATQAALAAAKGTGYVIGHPAGRWCREALFFLVWSCPQPVLSANLCELAGLGD